MKLDDLISRAAALEALGECPYNWNDWPEEIQAVYDWESHKEAIERIPAVNAVPIVHGRWIDENSGDSLDPRMRCSICTGVERRLVKWRYCPNCGAKMDGRDSK